MLATFAALAFPAWRARLGRANGARQQRGHRSREQPGKQSAARRGNGEIADQPVEAIVVHGPSLSLSRSAWSATLLRLQRDRQFAAV
jgi:hypothetical protein